MNSCRQCLKGTALLQQLNLRQGTTFGHQLFSYCIHCIALCWVGLCCGVLSTVCTAGTQNASEDDHIRDAGLTADLIEEADRCQTPQGSVSGLDDDANLHGTSSQADDQIVTSDRMPGRLGDGTRTHEHHWPSALVLDPSDTADEALQLHGTASQQQHHEGMTEAQQARPAHQGFHHALQGQSPAQHSGYQTMNGHGSFKPGKIQDHFRRIGVGAKAVGELAAYADPLHPVVSVGFRHLSHSF